VRHFERQFQVDGDVARNRFMDRWIGELCSYNFAAGSFHTKKLCSRLFREKLIDIAVCASLFAISSSDEFLLIVYFKTTKRKKSLYSDFKRPRWG